MKNYNKKNLRVIILIGPPGAGKGTQAILISEKLNLYHFETSKIIEERIKNAKKGEFLNVDGKKYYFEKERKLWEKGILCSPPFVTQLVKEKIKLLRKEGKGIVLSGSPRTLYEGEKIIPLIKKLYKNNILVFYLELKAKDSIWRNSHRRICQLLRHPILYNKETKNLLHCPLDGSKLIKRGSLDTPEVIKIRLKEYKERTIPLINFLKKENISIKKVNASLSPSQVFKNILKKINDNR